MRPSPTTNWNRQLSDNRVSNRPVMSKPLKVALPLILAAGFLAYLVYSTFSLASVTCEVCVEFNGRVDCRIASGTTADEATDTALNNACALLTNGRDELISCTQMQAQSTMCALE